MDTEDDKYLKDLAKKYIGIKNRERLLWIIMTGCGLLIGANLNATNPTYQEAVELDRQLTRPTRFDLIQPLPDLQTEPAIRCDPEQQMEPHAKPVLTRPDTVKL